MNGTHKPDAEIAATVPGVIRKMIQDGVMKPENAPNSPIKGFEDANQFLLRYPSDASQPSASGAASAPAALDNAPAPAPPAATDCPKDQPWLCPVAGAAPPPTQMKAVGKNLAGSSTQSTASNADGAPASAAPQPTPEDSTGKTAAVDDKTPFYEYGANDVVGITVAGEASVSGQYVIMPDGRMSLPLLTEFRAAGLTGPQLRDLITQKLRDEGGILEPVVNVQLLRSNSKHYTVFGAVMRPGPFPLIQETTLMDALSMAGFQEFANKDKITVRRGNKLIVTFNFKKAVSKGEGLDKNITLEDGDTIYVPE